MCATHAPAGSGHAAVASRPPRRLQSPPLVASVTLCTSYVSTSSRRSPLLHLPPLPPLWLHIPQYLVSSNHFFTFTILFWFAVPFSMTYWFRMRSSGKQLTVQSWDSKVWCSWTCDLSVKVHSTFAKSSNDFATIFSLVFFMIVLLLLLIIYSQNIITSVITIHLNNSSPRNKIHHQNSQVTNKFESTLFNQLPNSYDFRW